MTTTFVIPNPNPTDLSHMPFLFQDERKLGIVFAWSPERLPRVPAYSRSGVKRAWKLAYGTYDPANQSVKPIHLLNTGLENNEVSCSPCLSRSKGEIQLSFIGTTHHGTGVLEHHLFRMTGPSMDRLTPAVRICESYCGFWREDLIATGTGSDGRFELQGAVNGTFSTNFKQIERLSFDPERPSQLLITGTLIDNELSRTIVFHAQREVVLGELQLRGTPTYKPAVCDGVIAFPVAVNIPRQEGWRLSFSTSYGLIPTIVVVDRIG